MPRSGVFHLTVKRTDIGIEYEWYYKNILLDKLPDILGIEQKKNKVKNNLQYLREQGFIHPFGKKWIMSKKE